MIKTIIKLIVVFAILGTIVIRVEVAMDKEFWTIVPDAIEESSDYGHYDYERY